MHAGRLGTRKGSLALASAALTAPAEEGAEEGAMGLRQRSTAALYPYRCSTTVPLPGQDQDRAPREGEESGPAAAASVPEPVPDPTAAPAAVPLF